MNHSLHHQPKARLVYDALREIIKSSEADARLPTTGEMKNRWSVSADTLNLALRELEREHLTYSVRGVGIFVAPSRQTIMLCDTSFFQGDDASPFWQMLLDLAQGYANQKNENFELHFVRPPGYKGESLPPDVRRQLQAGQIAGVLVIGVSPEIGAALSAQNVPVVSFAGSSKWNVELENASIAELGVKELARRGCRRIAMWRPWHPYREDSDIAENNHLELDSFRLALKAAGLEIDESQVRMRDFLGSFSARARPMSPKEQGFLLAKEVFSNPKKSRPDGILLYDDMMASGVLEALREQQIELERDVLIATQSNKNSPVLCRDHDKLICIEYVTAELVEEMFRLLHDTVRTKNATPRTVLVHPNLVVGKELSQSSATKPATRKRRG